METITPIKIYHAEPLHGTLFFIAQSSTYQPASLEDCELVLYHDLYKDARQVGKFLRQISEKYKPSGKRVLIFIMLDDESDYGHFDNLILLRVSARASKLRSHEIMLPYLWEGKEEPYPLSPKSQLPVVGFCGLLSKHRKKLVNLFLKNKQITSDFLVREKFWGGKPHDQSLINEFFDNIEHTQFTLSNRGAGNFSMRFYQVLSCGRIPVLVNTNMLLPFSDKIAWNEILVFEDDEETCLQRTLQIHKQNLTQELQLKCRQIYDDFLSPKVYFSQLIAEIRQKSLLQVHQEQKNKAPFSGLANQLYKKLFKA